MEMVKLKVMEGEGLGYEGYEELQKVFQQQIRTLPATRGMRTVHLKGLLLIPLGQTCFRCITQPFTVSTPSNSQHGS